MKLFKQHSSLYLVLIALGIPTILFKYYAQYSQNHHIDYEVLVGANIILYILSLISLNVQVNAMYHSNPNVFVRTVMGSMMVKMLIIVGIVLIYAMASGDHFNKRSVFISLIFYLIYLAAEVFTLMKLNKKPDA